MMSMKLVCVLPGSIQVTRTSFIFNRHRTMQLVCFIIVHPSDNTHQTHCGFELNACVRQALLLFTHTPVIIFGHLCKFFRRWIAKRIQNQMISHTKKKAESTELNMNYGHPHFNDMV